MKNIKRILMTIKSQFTKSTPTPSRTSVFFSTIGHLVQNGRVIQERDFKIEKSADMRLLHMNIESVYREYAQTTTYHDRLTKQSLLAYLQANTAWVSFGRSFCNNEQQPMQSVVFNYDILKEKLAGNIFLLNL